MIDWRALPSLPALRAFDAAVRTGSYSEAARTLNVTHAAIAQHVRALEKHFGQTLMTRAGQGMAPTPEGALLATHLTEGFGTIAAGCARLSDITAMRPFTLSCTLAFAENWLMPRVSDFWAKHPDIELAILPNNALVNFKTDLVDCAVRYGHGAWPGLTAMPLLTGEFIVVAAPQLAPAQPVGNMAELGDVVWVTNDIPGEHHVLVRDFGFHAPDIRMRTFATNGLVLAAVRSGLGFSIQSRSLIGRDLADGTLVEVFAKPTEGLGYWIVHPEGAETQRLRLFKRWLLSHA
ncbi:LysR family transcriptional regulator [Thalassobacter stenotrophicus]|uniref:Gcv operon activator n=2 Tax=Thalassobacter stenotrophicus TaxID=266809 RepID=A0A0N7LT61_9RHOB|nr:LysR family transcriptional regulator [Thalassobacter stenotrophicus]PVZ49753.1 LysR family transcriptional regulator [Thalassobacter stenotrophicus]CUH59802.1 Gcv operon activator [Thalassobacter stenotrophicus]SHI88905.1 LysR family transcriptional regulator, glycine cleavage system transcriptional activator [Thalassobacter stenotrophicus DSM 16310]